MTQVRVGTASWTDKTLIASGWYPPGADTPEERLRFYASQFPLVEVDATYYALPAGQTAASWAERTPAGFTFNVKAFSLFTGHPTPVRAMPADLREAAGKSGKDRVYRTDVDPSVTDQAWDQFPGAGLAWAAAATGQIAGPLGAPGVGVAAPTIIGQLAKAIPLTASTEPCGNPDSPSRVPSSPQRVHREPDLPAIQPGTMAKVAE
jgi:hypothetical protein